VVTHGAVLSSAPNNRREVVHYLVEIHRAGTSRKYPDLVHKSVDDRSFRTKEEAIATVLGPDPQVGESQEIERTIPTIAHRGLFRVKLESYASSAFWAVMKAAWAFSLVPGRRAPRIRLADALNSR
jgi:hypothetical protein